MVGRLVGMAAGCVVCWAAASALAGRGAWEEIGFGMAAPLLAVGGSWVMIDRAHRREPGRVMAVMLQMMMAKMLFFAAWVVVGLVALALRPTFVMVSFTASFIVLHGIEAVWLHRLYARRAPVSR